MNVGPIEEQLARLSDKYLKSLQVEGKLIIEINNLKTDEGKRQDYIFQLEVSKQNRKFLEKKMKELENPIINEVNRLE
jgi:hypothetical protein